MQFDLPPCQEPLLDHPHPQVETEYGFTVDKAAEPILRFLWANGIQTICSCQGAVVCECKSDNEPHESEGFIAVIYLDMALKAYELLTCEFGLLATLQRVGPDDCHETSDEYTIWTPPMETFAEVVLEKHPELYERNL